MASTLMTNKNCVLTVHWTDHGFQVPKKEGIPCVVIARLDIQQISEEKSLGVVNGYCPKREIHGAIPGV